MFVPMLVWAVAVPRPRALASTATTATVATKPPELGALTAKQVFNKCRASVCRVEAGNAQGTGFVTPFGIQTCWHVIAGAARVTFKFADGTSVESTALSAGNKARDCAMFPVPAGDTHPALFYEKADPSVGDAAYVIGSPEGLDQTLTEGLVSAIRRDRLRTLVQLSAAVSHGSSGSPILDGRGNVIGMVVETNEAGQSLNFGLSASDAVKTVLEGVDLSTVASGAGPTGGAARLLTNPMEGSMAVSLVTEDPGADAALLGVTRTDVEGWLRDAIGAGCPRLMVLSEAAQSALADRLLQNGLRAASNDVRWTTLHVALGVIRPGTVLAAWNVSLEYSRGVTVYNGITPADVYTDGSFGIVGAANDQKDELHNAVKRLVSRFCDAWNKANPAPVGAPPNSNRR